VFFFFSFHNLTVNPFFFFLIMNKNGKKNMLLCLVFEQFGWTPLQMAAQDGRDKCLALLIASRADINKPYEVTKDMFV